MKKLGAVLAGACLLLVLGAAGMSAAARVQATGV